MTSRLRASARRECRVVDISIVAQADIGGQAPEWILYSGHQSWDPAGLALLTANGPAGEPLRRESWWVCALTDGSGGGIAGAAGTATKCAMRFQAQGSMITISLCEAPGLEPQPVLWEARSGARFRGEALVLSAGDDARVVLAELLRGGPRAPVPQGWLSWYHYGPWVSREDVLENSQILAHPDFRALGYRVIQIDDGWQHGYGDWRPNQKFSNPGLAELAADLRARGQTMGVWTAPFLVSASSDLSDHAPDSWFLIDPDSGRRSIDPRHSVFGPMYVLDARRRAVQNHLEMMFARLYEAGVRYFKVDFLYAGAYAGTAALRAGMAAIRRGVRDAYLLACGAPLLPVVGFVEGCRIGQDTATPIFNFELGSPEPTIFGEEVNSVARNVAARLPMHRWFHLDADVALVGGNLALGQARQLVTVAALTGGPFFTTDDLARLSPERLALVTNPEVLKLVGAEPAMPEWEPNSRDQPPSVWRSAGGATAIFNWSLEPSEVALRVPSGTRVRDLWERLDLGSTSGILTVIVPPTDVRLLRIGTA